MGLLQKLKSALGLDGTGSSESGRSGDVDVTVEREPSTEDEDAVKGTETASSGEPETPEPDDGGSEGPSAEEFEPLADESDPVATEDADDAELEVEGSTDPVTELNGIGPAYGDRLAGAGVETVGELAAADAATLADRIDLGESRVAGWVEQANEY